ncbi:hypothetical protein [Bradyrhizobium diazoefficiens]|uniref:hypothetical protein n=1 Tax=Bradyrhizobium diazoefficiens TaxID=1355477 RepID=UPI00272DC40F|nr:hypothetical protein [Bradyrhizobium diazoefficiens]WLA67656.1 hypothetical protein QNN01_13825 [Bradyrhizobium diazoefficiens]
MSTSALNNAIYQNTPGNSEGYPLGVPTSYGWYQGDTGYSYGTPPSNFSSMTSWAVIYPEAGQPVDSSASIQVANYKVYLHLTNGTWVLAQDQATQGIGGAQYAADFSTQSTVPWNETKLPDGSVSVLAPQSGYTDHFWPGTRGTYSPGTVDGVFAQVDMKTNDTNANLVAQLGADWWLNSTAQFVSDFSNSPLVGNNDWVKLTTDYKTLYYTSFTTDQLKADPPPGLEPDTAPVTQPTTPTTPNVAPTVTQASASPGTGTEHVGDTVTLTLGFSEAVTVNGTPTLSLNDSAKATYVSGSGTSSLVFKTTVASTDTNTSALAITGVNLPNGATIKDSGGLAANLAGAVKTFSGLQISTATSNTPTTPTPTTPTSSVTRPVLAVADSSLWVAGRGGTVDLGTKVSTTDTNDRVTVNIAGLPRYETITSNIDGQTFRGDNITLTAAQVDGGLTLHSYYRGGGHPTATLTLTASAKDPTTGAVASSAPQTITVTDPRPSATTTSPQTTTVTTPSSTSAGPGLGVTQPQVSPVTGTVASTAPQPITVGDHSVATAAGPGALANQAFAGLQQQMDLATGTLATTKPQAIVTDPNPAIGTSTASLASQSFALLNQYMAGNTGRVDPGAIVAAVSQATGFGPEALLARPVH